MTLKSWLALVWVSLAATTAPGATTPQAVDFIPVPEGAKRLTISLAVSEEGSPRQQGYLAQRSPEQAAEVSSLPAEISLAYTGKEFSAYEIAALPDGTRYLVVLNEDKALKFLNRNEASMWYARIYRNPPGTDAKPELLREGFQSPGNDVTFPVELQLPGIGTTKLTKLRTEIGYSVNSYSSSKFQVYTGRGAPLNVTGSQVTQEGKLTLTVSVPEEMVVTRDTQVSLRFEPSKPGLPERVASGKVSDFLTLGSTRLVVAGIEPDFSKATLAIVAGSLEETLKQQLQLGEQMPAFSQVDLVTRKTVTKEELLARTKGAAPVVFVFGDLPQSGVRSPYGGGPSYPGMMPALSLPPGEVAEQLGLELEPKPVVVFVTRQISMDFLYGDLRNKTPDYLVLTDFPDPLRTSFRIPQMNPGGWYGPPNMATREPALRQLFNLPERMVSIAAFDSTGKVVYVKADAGNDFLPSIAQTRAALKK